MHRTTSKLKLFTLFLFSLSLGASPVLSVAAATLAGARPAIQAQAPDVAQYVDPFIGTGGPGNTFPGAVMPWGMAAISPDTGTDPAGYKSGAANIQGFSQIHLSGVGCGDFGNILLQPTTGAIQTTEANYDSTYNTEVTSPGYYKANLSTWGTVAEVSANTRATISKFTFPARTGDANIIVDVSHGLSPSVGGFVNLVSNTEVEGWNQAGGFCGASNRYTLYFVARFSKAAASTGKWTGTTQTTVTAYPSSNGGTDIGAYYRFNTAANEAVYVRVGISYVSLANARANLDAEIPNTKSFDTVKLDAYNAWNTQLGKIQVTGGTTDQRKIFYTGLYHNLIHPSVFSDVNGQYQGMDSSGVKTASGYTQYHVYSLWDTYRNTHALLTLVYPERQLDMVKSMLAIYNERGWLPKWQLAGAEAHTMVGDPASAVIAETYVKGIRNFDTTTAYAAVKKQATQLTGNDIRPGMSVYVPKGYIPKDNSGGDWVWGAASTSLEYYYADWAVAEFAKALGNTTDYNTFHNRSLNWSNLWDSSTGFIRPKNDNGTWMSPFDPVSTCCDQGWAGSGGPGYVEGNAWQYTWMLPHDLPGLKTAMGGDTNFTNKLQQAFDTGQYVLWNEPDMLYPYAFTYVPGQAWRTQQRVRTDMSTYYNTSRSGIPGNDDCGATSAVYVFDAMGLYPVNPASAVYNIGSPIFNSVTIALNPAFYSGGQFMIQANTNSATNQYIQSATLNGASYNSAMLNHSVVTAGGNLTLNMGSTATAWGGGSPPPTPTRTNTPSGPTATLTRTPTPVSGSVVLDDFESGTLSKWATFIGGGATISMAIDTVTVAVGTRSMKVTYNVPAGGWAGVSQGFTTSQNWSAQSGFDFRFFGNNTGVQVRLEINDNSPNAGNSPDAAERFEYKFTDNVAGWRQITVPWSSFTRRTDWQPAGAPNDGLTLTQMWGFSFAPLSGNNVFYLDQVQLSGGASPTNTPTRTNTPVGPTNTPTATPTRTNTPPPAGNTHGGTWAIRAALPAAAGFSNISQAPTGLPTNTSYVASLWIKGTGSVQLYIKNGNWGADIAGATVRCNATASWTQCTTPAFNTGANTQITYIIQDSYGDDPAGTVYIDNMFLGISGGTNRLTNPGLESGDVNWGHSNSVFTIVQNP
jgi:predicted alpha-1,2-mannosidase